MDGGGKRYWSASDVFRYSYCPVNFLLSIRGVKVDVPEGEEFEREVGEEIEKYSKALSIFRSIDRALTVIIILAIAMLSAVYASLLPQDERLRFAISVGVSAIAVGSAMAYMLNRRKASKTNVVYALIYIAGLNTLLLLSIAFIDYIKLIITTEVWMLLSTVVLMAYLYTRKRIENWYFLDRDVVYRDDGKAPMMVSERYSLKGRPDYVIGRNGKYIPVEIKNIEKPEKVIFSHLMQVVAYSVMV